MAAICPIVSLLQVIQAMFVAARRSGFPLPFHSPATLLIFVALAGIALGSTGSAQDQTPEKVDFVKQIKPIFEKHCLSCHGPEKEEDFRIDDRQAAMDYIIPGKAKESQMYTVLISEDPEELMPPPDEKNPLQAEQIKLIERWIDEGAAWPDGVEFRKPEARQGGAGEQSPSVPGTAQPAAPANLPQAGAAPVLDDDSTKPAPVPSVPAAPRASAPAAAQDSAVGQTSGEAAQAKSGEVAPAAPQPATEKDKPKETKPEKKAYSIYNAIGSLHPAILHLPIGLLFAAGLFALIGIRGNFVMSDCAYYCLWLGTFGAVLACVSGWWFSPMEGRGSVSAVQDLWDQQQPIFWHRTSALVMTFLAVLLCLFARSARLRDPDDGVLWKLGAMLLAVGIGFVGHNGGELTHGKNLYRDLTGLVEESTGWELDGK